MELYRVSKTTPRQRQAARQEMAEASFLKKIGIFFGRLTGKEAPKVSKPKFQYKGIDREEKSSEMNYGGFSKDRQDQGPSITIEKESVFEDDEDEEPVSRGLNFNQKWLIVPVVLAVVAVVAFFIYQNGGIKVPTSVSVQGPGNINIQVTLLSFALGCLFVLSLLESASRHDPLLLDFIGPWVLVAILVAGQLLGHQADWFKYSVGAALLAMVIGTFWNPAEEDESEIWNRIDLTNWYVGGIALIFIQKMGSTAVPYPEYLPITIPVVVSVIAIGKEFFRQPVFSLITLAIAIIPGVTQQATWISAGFAIEMLIAVFGAKKGWVNVRNSQHSISIGGRSFDLLIAWDLILFYLIVVVLIGLAIYGNYTIFQISNI